MLYQIRGERKCNFLKAYLARNSLLGLIVFDDGHLLLQGEEEEVFVLPWKF